MTLELEIDKWEIIDAWTCYYHKYQHEIDEPAHYSRKFVAPVIETIVCQ